MKRYCHQTTLNHFLRKLDKGREVKPCLVPFLSPLLLHEGGFPELGLLELEKLLLLASTELCRRLENEADATVLRSFVFPDIPNNLIQ